MSDEYKKYLDEIISELKSSEDGLQILNEYKEIIMPYLETWAKAKFMAIFGDVPEKQISKIIVKSIDNSISDLSDALKVKVVNYAKDKVENILRKIVTKYLIPALLGGGI